MNVAVVWIDREHAQLYLLSNDKMERRKFEHHHKENHRHARDAAVKNREEHGLFQEVGNALEGADKILILGPGVAKHHFRNYMTEQKPMLARKIAGVETVDHPSDGQIAAMARKFYEKVTA
jgi:stalled ribosome rescue protein Dom34